MKQSNHRLISLADYAGEENGHLKGRICEKRIFPITTVYLMFITPSLQTSCLCLWHKGIARPNDRLQQLSICVRTGGGIEGYDAQSQLEESLSLIITGPLSAFSIGFRADEVTTACRILHGLHCLNDNLKSVVTIGVWDSI